MANIIITSNSEFFNTGVDIFTFYDKTNKSFEFFEEDECPKNNNSFIMTPSTYEVEYYAHKIFDEILTDEEREIVDSYPYRKGFFRYLRETGIYETYRVAQERAAVFVAKKWAEENNLVIDWNI